MQDLQQKQQVQVARSNKHHPLNREAERYLNTLIEQGELDQRGYENLYVLQLLEWGLEELQELIQPGWWDLLFELKVDMQPMNPLRVLNYLLWTTEEREPTGLVQSLRDAKDPMEAVNELIEVLQNNLQEAPYQSVDIPAPSYHCLPDNIEFGCSTEQR